MERRLIVMRHARAKRPDEFQTDHERPLTAKGQREATEIAERLIELGWVPDQVVGSDANRTRQTWEAMESSFSSSPPTIWSNELYLAGVDAVVEQLMDVDDNLEDILLLGHNPGWQAVVTYFSGRRHRLTTANAALLKTIADSWRDTAASGRFELVQVLRPRSL